MKLKLDKAEAAPAPVGDKTNVLFRMFKGEVLALFPAIAATVGKPQHCESYAHIGQHGSADLRGVIRRSRPAQHREFIGLYRELVRIGYHLQIVKRCTAADAACRQQQLES